MPTMVTKPRCPDPNDLHPMRYPYPPDMLGLYVRTTQADPARPYGKRKRSWERVGYYCPDPLCRHVVLDPVPDPVPAAS